MTKLLLVNPNFTGVTLTPSLGLEYLAAFVRKHSDCEVRVVEPALERLDALQTLVLAKDADFVGLVCYTESRFQCFSFAQHLHQSNPNCTIIVGGPHVDTLDVEILEHYPFVDIAVRGEGENSLLSIISREPLNANDGITWRGNGAVIRNRNRVLSKDISMFDYTYELIPTQVGKWIDLEIPRPLQSLKSMPIIASRGCPFQCSFCAAHWHWNCVYRNISPVALVEKLSYLYHVCGVRYFRFYDALFFSDDRWALEFCDLLRQANLGIHFRIDVRVGTSFEVLSRLKQAGCDVVGFGIESGDNRILRNINKKVTRKQIEETINVCRQLGYWMIGFFMVALPGEDMPEVESSFELFSRLDVVNVQFFKIHPNTAFYDTLVRRGEIEDSCWFDPQYGFQTEYGNEVYYCKELFSSARFSIKDVRVLTDYSSCRYNVTHCSNVLLRDGTVVGSIILFLSFILSVMLKFAAGRCVYRRCFCKLADEICKRKRRLNV